ncbi:MAG TPA: CHAT domain-containing tetratricopeptide repeat protein [Thermoanaerobaculia bacterium]|nr:CHAT domain-containing tetratricopeptide repeat protein [Thermoanaerobaculia bacterium]
MRRAFAFTALTAVLVVAWLAADRAVDLWHRVVRTSEMDEVVAASALLQYRPSQARLSAPFPYRAVRPPQRGRGKARTSRVRDLELFSVASRLRKEAGQEPSLPRLHALGVSDLLIGNAAQAVETLESAVRNDARGRGPIAAAIRRSENGALLNDLAVAYQTLVESGNGDHVRPLALEAAQRAYALQPTASAAWTRAIVIEAHHVRETAITAWRNYLALDPRSEWSDVARKRLAELEQPTDAEAWPAARARLLAAPVPDSRQPESVDRFRQEVRLWCEDELLPAWGDAVLRADPSADERLAKIEQLGRALERVSGESELADAVAAIRKAPPAAIRQFATGHVAYGAARRATRNPEPVRALREADVAIAAFSPSLTPFSTLARVERGAAIYLSNDYDRARVELNRLTDDETPLSDAAQGNVQALLGIIALQTGSYEEAAAHYKSALEAFRRAGERSYEAAMLGRLARAVELSGDLAQARAYRNQALELLDRTGDARHRHDTMMEAAFVAIGHDEQAVAELYLGTLVGNAKAARMQSRACTALMWRAANRYRLRQAAPAAADLEDAERICGAIPDPFVRERMLANLEIARFTVRGSEAGSSGLDGAIAFFRKSNAHVWLRTAYFARAKTLERTDPSAAERDYRTALEESEATRNKIDERLTRIAFTATNDEVADGYIEFLLRQGRGQDAFDVADRIRLRELVDSPTARWPAPPPSALVPYVQAALPIGTALIEYRVLSSSIVAWVLRPETLATVTLPDSIEDLREPMAALERDVAEAELIRHTSDLYDALLRRLEPQWKGVSALVIVPDDALERVPYGALYDRVQHRFLLATHATAISPSAALFVQSRLRERERSGGDDRMLVVKAGGGGETFAALPEATREAQAVARIYRDARIVDGGGQSGAQLLNQARDVTVLQFVGHTAMESDRSLRTLRLGEAPDARLGVDDIVAAPLSRLRLVYLSACETDSGPILKSEGSVTLARSFFAAGVPIVIGTLWPVGDDVARFAAPLFHERLRAGDMPAEALRRAQLEVQSRFPQSGDWAAFRVIGAGF